MVWHLTPRELRLAGQAYLRRMQREGLFVAWHVAALSRTDRLPSLAELLDPPTDEELQAMREQDERDFAAMTASHELAKVKKDG